VVNAGKVPVISPFDPFPYPRLSAITSLEAVLLAAIVLMKQIRMSIVADRRDHLDLQVTASSADADLPALFADKASEPYRLHHER
jgi:uncharacterized membrane protein